MPLTCTRCQHDNDEGARFCLQCGNMLEQPQQDGGDPWIGRIIADRYRVVSLLGEGGMGRVYLAEQKMGTATRKVAIKTLHPELSRDAQLVQRFHRECETVIALSHPNTVQFYDFGELPDRTLYIVMEYIEGESLAHVLQRGPLEPGRVDRILVQICGSLQEAHDHGVVHRDLKPENILLTRRGGQNDFVKVLDFGIAKRTEAEDDQSQKLTKQGMVLGTPPYMSPEQFAGKTLDARSDIYSLGVMTYEMLTGRLPFEAATPWEWATKHLTTPPTPFEQHPVAAQIPDFKKAAVMRALAKNPAERFGSVTEFMQAFTGIADAESAWALVTHLAARPSGQGGPIAPPAGAGRGPAPTPSPMPQAPGGASWNTGSAVTPGWNTGTGTAPPGGGPYAPTGGQPVSSGSIALKVFLLLGGGMLLAAAAAGAIFFATHASEHEDGSEPVEPGPVAQAGTPPSGGDRPAAGATAPKDEPPAVPSGGGDEGGQPSGTEAPPKDEPAKDERAAAGQPGEEGGHHHGKAGGNGAGGGLPAEASAALGRARQAAERGRVEQAASHLRAALRAGASRSHPQVAALRRRLATLGGNRVGNLIMGGRCDAAQRLYVKLRSVGAHKQAGRQFSSDWCPRP